MKKKIFVAMSLGIVLICVAIIGTEAYQNSLYSELALENVEALTNLEPDTDIYCTKANSSCSCMRSGKFCNAKITSVIKYKWVAPMVCLHDAVTKCDSNCECNDR